MIPAARLSAIIAILDETELGAQPPLDRVCDSYFRGNRYIGSHDRRFISQAVYSVVRHRNRIDRWLQRARLDPDNRLRVFAASVLMLGFTPEQLQKECNAPHHAPKPPNGNEMEALRYIAGEANGQITHPSMDDATRYECPAWMLEKFQSAFGDSWRAEADALLGDAPVDLRVNTLKATREEILKSLPPEWQAQPTQQSPWGIRLLKRHNLGGLPELKSGAIEVQDEGSQLISLWCNAKPGMQVLDLCAGAGGKSLAMAATMQNKGRITACDNHETRLKKSAERFRRAGVHNHELKLLDAEGKKWLRRADGRFDLVLCDVPCSGTGTWRRNPDMRHKLKPADIAELQQVQKDILEEAAPLVKSGGRLVYATCSFLREENESRIESFCAAHPEFKLLEQHRLTPVQHGTDGFFAAILRKN